MEAAAAGDEAKLKQILAANPGAAGELDDTGMNALHWAARNGHPRCVAMLLDAGVNVNVQGGKLNQTPLHYVATRTTPGHLETAALLLERGASRQIQDRGGSTPLAIAFTQVGNRRPDASEMTKLLYSE
jgi:ankyrin repeat protein